MDQEYEVHAYGTSAHLHLYTQVLGIQPAVPGFARLRIAPQPGDLHWARGKVATPHGPIESAWKVGDTTFSLEVALPAEVAYACELPDGFADYRVLINGLPVTTPHRIFTGSM